jgi:hypothetical protein
MIGVVDRRQGLEHGVSRGGRKGHHRSIYGGIFECLSGAYLIRVMRGRFLDGSDFHLYLMINRAEFAEGDLIRQFGDPNQVLSR